MSRMVCVQPKVARLGSSAVPENRWIDYKESKQVPQTPVDKYERDANDVETRRTAAAAAAGSLQFTTAVF